MRGFGTILKSRCANITGALSRSHITRATVYSLLLFCRLMKFDSIVKAYNATQRRRINYGAARRGACASKCDSDKTSLRDAGRAYSTPLKRTSSNITAAKRFFVSEREEERETRVPVRLCASRMDVCVCVHASRCAFARPSTYVCVRDKGQRKGSVCSSY